MIDAMDFEDAKQSSQEDLMDVDQTNSTHRQPSDRIRNPESFAAETDRMILVSAGGNGVRNMGVPLTMMFPHDDNTQNKMSLYYKKYTQSLIFEENLRRDGSDEEQKKAHNVTLEALNDINILRIASEDTLSKDYASQFARIFGPTGTAIDFNRLEYDYKNEFFNPNVLYFMRGIVRSIISPIAATTPSTIRDERKEVLRRIRHWMNNLRVVAAGAFGKTLVSGILGINEFLALKYPLNATTDQRHEYLIGLKINSIRELGLCANVVYTYGLFTCSGAKVEEGDEKGNVTSWCSTDSSVKTEYVTMENVDNTGTLGDFLIKERTNLTPQFVTTLIAQWIFTLYQLEQVGVTHWDSHLHNWLSKPVDRNSVARFAYEGRHAYVKTGGILAVLFDWGLSSGPAGDVYVGPDPQLQQNTSCYFNGRPFPMADVYRVFMNFYYIIVTRILSRGKPTKQNLSLAIFIEDIIVNYFKIENKGWFYFRRENLIDPMTNPVQKKQIEEELRDLNFRRLPLSFQQIKIGTFIAEFFNINMKNGTVIEEVFNVNSLLQSYYPKWRDVVNFNDDIVIGSIPLFCSIDSSNKSDGVMIPQCKGSFEILSEVNRQPVDYFEVDNYKINIFTLPTWAQNSVVEGTINIIASHIDYAEDMSNFIGLAELPRLHKSNKGQDISLFLKITNDVSPRLLVEKYIDALLGWWFVEADMDHARHIMKEVGIAPGTSDINKMIDDYATSRNAVIYDAACKKVIAYERTFSAAMRIWFTDTTQSSQREMLITTQRNLKIAVDTLAVVNFI